MKDALFLDHISFSYKKNPVIKDFSLSVKKGSFTTLLGASGSGKTTILRLISGFLEPDSGSIFLDGIIQNGILTNKRRIAFVFQDYALFPHMTVSQNLMYGLKLQKTGGSKKQQKQLNLEKMHQTAKNLGIDELLLRYPAELSGGQQQRVALGRALVLEPSVLLMDEPLSSLDTALRLRVREELREIQQKLNITTVYVTHDQEEAFFLSDSIALLNDGKIIQNGSPRQIYFEPSNRFAASFTGRANFIEQEKNTFLVRPEWITLERLDSVVAPPDNKEVFSDSEPCVINGTVLSSEFLGHIIRYRIKTAQGILLADQSSTAPQFAQNTQVQLRFERLWQVE